ncbi:MAG: restriction endonuclease subunit S [Bacteroidota bacterium]|nr:restriction endonuclease subunit S [Bacteroidota bacterium]
MKNGWGKVKLRDIATKIGSGATPLGGKDSYIESGITLIRSLNVYDFKFEKDGLAFINQEQANGLSNVIVEHNDILLNITGASVARCCMVPIDVLPARVNQHVSIVRIAPDRADPKFVLYSIISPIYKNHLLALAQSGATREALTKEKIGDFEIKSPPLNTQRRIASILSAYDDLIENNTRRIKILEEMASAIYREWFVEFRAPGVELRRATPEEKKLTGKPARRSGGGLFPKGWEVRKLSSLVETQYGYTESASESEVGPKYLRGMDINKTSYIQWDSVPYCPISETDYLKYKLNVGDILIIRMADPGKIGIVEKEVDAVFASYLIRLKIKNFLISTYYLFYYLISNAYQGYITGASTGTTRKSASAGVITDVNMVIPPDYVRNKFEEIITSFRRMINNLIERNSNLRRTRDLLLPKLISGEVNVEEMETNIKEVNR